MARKKQRRNLKRKVPQKRKEIRASLILPFGLAVIFLFAVLYLNQAGLVGSAVYVGETAPVKEINLMKEGSVTFTVLPTVSKQIQVFIKTGISATDDTPQTYSFTLSNKGSSLYGYELKLQNDIIAQDILYVGSSSDISLVYLNLNDTVPDLKVFYAAGKIAVQNLHTVSVVCGNGLVEGSEQCDDGNILNGDGCSSTCKVEPKAVPPSCGDGVINQMTEQCDGQDLGVSTCETQPGFVRGVLGCKVDCTLDTSGCVPPTPVVPPATTSVVNGTKLSLGVITPANNTFSTLITATEDFTQDLFVYTVLYDVEGKVLALESDEITGGMAKDEFYVVTATYDPADQVKEKVVLVFDVEPNSIVYGKLEENYR